MTGTTVVTGGAGFIGSNYVRLALARTSDRVVIVDKLTYAGSRATIDDVLADARVSFVKADIGDRAAMAALLREYRPWAVVNFAAESHVDRSIDDPRAFVDTNLVGVFELLEAARAHWTALAAPERERFRFLHVSTDEVYGALGPTGAFSEDTAYAPSSPYAASKAGGDLLVRAWHRTYGLPALVTNCSNNYGPYQFPEKLIPLMILNALDGLPLPIYGDGRQVREWLHVTDHCAGVLLALQRGRPGERYNIGGGEERTNLEIVDQVCAALEEVAPARENAALAGRGLAGYAALKRFVADRPGHDRRYAVDGTKARRELGWRPTRTLTAGLAATVRWYVEHRGWCEAIQRGGQARVRRGVAARAGA